MADNSPIAHEGNPKEDEITITGGSVLSTATLTVYIPPSVVVTPGDDIVPPPDGGGGGDGCVCADITVPSSCSNEYMTFCKASDALTWTGSQLEWYIPSCSGNSASLTGAGMVTVDCSSAGAFLFYSSIPSGWFGGGDPVVHDIVLATWNTWGLVFDSIVGVPNFGVVVNAPRGNSCTDFSGLVVLFDHQAGEITLGQYTNANLDAGDRPTLISTLGNVSLLSEAVSMQFQKGLPTAPPGTRLLQFNMESLTDFLIDYQEVDGGIPLADSPVGVGIFWLKSAGSSFRYNYMDTSSTFARFRA